MKYLHLDSEYRRRWQEYHTAAGKTFDSRVINWRNVEWEKVIQIDTYMNNQKHSVKCNDPRFKFFLCFRWGGQEPIYKNGVFEKYKPIKIWTVGWSDGKTAFLKDICFYTGNFMKNYTAPLSEFKMHIHPRIKELQQCYLYNL